MLGLPPQQFWNRAQKPQMKCTLELKIVVETLFTVWFFLKRYKRVFLILSLILLQFPSTEVASYKR